MNLKRTLATLGLAASLAGCGAANTNVVRYEHAGLTYIVQHETGISVPDCDWDSANRQAISLAEEGRIPAGYGVTGHLHANGTIYQEGDDGPRYDAVLWTVDTDHDNRPDVMRLDMNTQITTAPDIRVVGRSRHVRVLVQDVNHDGDADRGLIDSHDAQNNPGYDGTYDELEMLDNMPMQRLINDRIWYPRQ